MNILKITTILVLLPFVGVGQSIPDWLVGNWYAVRVEDLQKNEVSRGSTLVRFQGNGKYNFSSCNGGGGTFYLQGDQLHLNGGVHSYKYCPGWESILEEALGGSQPCTYTLSGSTLEVKVGNEFIVTFMRQSVKKKERPAANT